MATWHLTSNLTALFLRMRVRCAALVDSGLVLDGLLVIDRLGRTNDPFILAGGSVTTYQRKLQAADMAHPYYSSHEIGRKVQSLTKPEEQKAVQQRRVLSAD